MVQPLYHLQPSEFLVKSVSSCFNNHLSYENNSANLNSSSNSQKSLQAQIDNKSLSLLRDIYSLRDQARLNTISSTYAGVWIKAIPNEKLSLELQKHDFITSITIWLGIPIFPSHSNTQRCVCGHILDTFGDHTLSCAMAVVLQVQNGMILLETQTSTASLASKVEKDEHHKEDIVSLGGLFFPLVVEILGHWTPSSLPLKTIPSKTISCSTTSLSKAFNNLMQQLSVKPWIYNARLVLGCLQLHSCNNPFGIYLHSN